MSRAIGGYELVKRWSESERPPLVCVQCNQEHTAGGGGALGQEGRVFEVRLEGSQLPASHRYQRRTTGFRCDPTALPVAALGPEGEPADQKKTGNAALQQALGAEQLKSARVWSAQASAHAQRAP